MQTQMVQTENATASEENIMVFWFQRCVRVCRDQTSTPHGSDNGRKNGG
jgi:hypothetical protein